jgi:hypothetical protein
MSRYAMVLHGLMRLPALLQLSSSLVEHRPDHPNCWLAAALYYDLKAAMTSHSESNSHDASTAIEQLRTRALQFVAKAQALGTF